MTEWTPKVCVKPDDHVLQIWGDPVHWAPVEEHHDTNVFDQWTRNSEDSEIFIIHVVLLFDFLVGLCPLLDMGFKGHGVKYLHKVSKE